MRFKANKDRGDPVLRGTQLGRAKDGTYQVTDAADIETMRALGYADADAPAAPLAPADTRLHDAAVAALAAFGVTVSDQASDDVIAKALGDLPKLVEDRVAAAVDAGKKK